MLQTSVNTLTADGGAGAVCSWPITRRSTLTSASATGGAVSISALGDLDVGTVTAAGQAVTLTATGALIDPSGPALNVTAASATLNGSSIGSPSDQFETQVSSITATATSGGIYISDLGTGSSDTHRDGAGTGGRYRFHQRGQHRPDDGHRPGQYGHPAARPGRSPTATHPHRPAVNITAQTLDIVAPGGIGTAANPLEVSWLRWPPRTAARTGSSWINAGPLAITKAALAGAGQRHADVRCRVHHH